MGDETKEETVIDARNRRRNSHRCGQRMNRRRNSRTKPAMNGDARRGSVHGALHEVGGGQRGSVSGTVLPMHGVSGNRRRGSVSTDVHEASDARPAPSAAVSSVSGDIDDAQARRTRTGWRQELASMKDASLAEHKKKQEKQ